MILVIDNYDSFTYNLVHLLAGEEVRVIRNDAPDLRVQAELADGLLFSPGPGHPGEAGLMEELIIRYYKEKPILGICLGHQAIGEVFGATICKAPQIMHGKQSIITCQPTGLFEEMASQQTVMRYHSLMIDPASLPEELIVTAESSDGLIMAIQHQTYPVYGLQYHPESIGTAHGQQLMNAFCKKVGKSHATTR